MFPLAGWPIYLNDSRKQTETSSLNI